MWLNGKKITDSALHKYSQSLSSSCPNHIVIDDLFDEAKLDKVLTVLRESQNWQTQKHTYSALYVDNAKWQNTATSERFVSRDVWQREAVDSNNAAKEFLAYLRSDSFISVLSRIFKVPLTDINVAAPDINTNYFRLAAKDFVEQHADDSPGRQVCMLLYLNKNWSNKAGGELAFKGAKEGKPIIIAPLYNRCVLFNPASMGSEHWVEKLREKYAEQYRYNVTSWYWSE
jgi:Rps23 Pro-64 3,4-dihydroxylase Tpa1-like proline 4-hydroxylase